MKIIEQEKSENDVAPRLDGSFHINEPEVIRNPMTQGTAWSDNGQ